MGFKYIKSESLPENTGTRGALVYLDRAFTIAGLKPPKEPSRWYTCYTFFNLTMCLIVLPLIFLMGCLDSLYKFTPGELVTTLQFDFNVWGFSVKFLVLYLQRQRLINANLLLDKFDAHCTMTNERAQIRHLAALGNRIYIIYFTGYMGFVVTSLADGLINNRVPFNLYNFFIDWRESRTNFYIECFIEFIGGCIAVYCNEIIDVIPIIYVLILRTHVKMLTERISREFSEHEDWSPDQHRRALIDSIKLHRNMLMFSDELRPLISLTTFIQFFLCGTVLGLSIINLMFFADRSSYVCSGIYLLDVLLQTFPLCYLCNSLVDDCLGLADALFHSSWYNRDKIYQKTLLHFLQKVQQPITFTALGIFPISLATNITFAKFAFTVYTLAKEAKIDEMFKN